MLKYESLSFPEVLAHLEETKSDFIIADEAGLSRYAEKLSSFADFVVAREGKEMKGLIAYYCNQAPSAFVTHVWVSNFSRGGGICGKMLQLVMMRCREKLFDSIRLEVRENNLPAIRAYRKFGFQTVEKNGDKYLMEYKID